MFCLTRSFFVVCLNHYTSAQKWKKAIQIISEGGKECSTGAGTVLRSWWLTSRMTVFFLIGISSQGNHSVNKGALCFLRSGRHAVWNVQTQVRVGKLIWGSCSESESWVRCLLRKCSVLWRQWRVDLAVDKHLSFFRVFLGKFRSILAYRCEEFPFFLIFDYKMFRWFFIYLNGFVHLYSINKVSIVVNFCHLNRISALK